MDDLVKSSYQYCYRDEFESFVGDSDSVDLAECESEKVVRVWLVDPSFQSNLSWALRKLQDVKLIIDRYGLQLDGMGVQRGKEPFEDQAMLSDKLTVLVNDKGIVMEKLGYALYGGQGVQEMQQGKVHLFV